MFSQQYFSISSSAFQDQNKFLTATQDGKIQLQQQQNNDAQLWFFQPHITQNGQQEQIAGFSIVNKQTQQALRFDFQTGQVVPGNFEQDNVEYIWQIQSVSQQNWIIFAANTSSCLTIDQDQTSAVVNDFQQLDAQQFAISIIESLDQQQAYQKAQSSDY